VYEVMVDIKYIVNVNTVESNTKKILNKI